jgi:heme-degrading monooxygenase HmoA
MFAIMYEFTVKPENAADFTQIWRSLTLLISELSNSKGSRLHNINPTHWIAYALWPSREAWEESDLNQPEIVTLRQNLLDVCEDIRIIYQMDVVEDLIS